MHEIISFHKLERLRTVQRFFNLIINEKNELRDIVKMAAGQCRLPLAAITLANGATLVKNGLGHKLSSKLDFFYEKVIKGQKLVVLHEAELKNICHDGAGQNDSHSIRFYAGLPLTTQDGHPLGSFCLMDVKPRHLTDAQVNTLEILSRKVIRILDFK